MDVILVRQPIQEHPVRALTFPFRIVPGGTLATTSRYEEIVRAQVIDGLMTNLGERVMRPNYGCDIQAALFDPSDELVRLDAASQITNVVLPGDFALTITSRGETTIASAMRGSETTTLLTSSLNCSNSPLPATIDI